MTVIKIKPNGTEIVNTERGKEKVASIKQVRENIIIRMIGIIIMDIKCRFTNKTDIEMQVDHWRKEVARRKK